MKTEEITRFRRELIRWYAAHRRPLPWRESSNPYHIWVSEIMLQQTQVKTVLPYYEKFLKHFPDLKSLAHADLQDVLKIWEGLGYYARARNLHKAATIVLNVHGGKIPDDRKSFQALPGVGDYIASAVQSIAFHHPYSVVDGNVKRLVARLFQIADPVNRSASHKLFKQKADELIDPQQPGDFNQSMMELGATVCKPRTPDCDLCPIPSFCRAYQTGKTGEYPRRDKTGPIPEYRLAAGVVYKNQQVLITQRKPEGLLGGLWEFPGGKAEEQENSEKVCIRIIREQTGLRVKVLSYLTQVKQAYTHFKIVMDVFRCAYVSGKAAMKGPADFRWISLDEIEQYPFHKAHLKFIPLLKGNPTINSEDFTVKRV